MNKLLSIIIIIILASSINASENGIAKMEHLSISIPSVHLKTKYSTVDTITIGLILPPDYAANKEKRFPVVYCLAGFGETRYEFMNEMKFSDIWNSMLNKEQESSIIVLIDGKSLSTCSFYTNSHVYGNWENLITEDIVNYIDKNYRTISSPLYRGLFGYAAGGTGAFNIGIKYPDIFSYIYLLNAGLSDETGVDRDIIGNEKEIISTINFLNSIKKLSPSEKISKINSLHPYSPLSIRINYGLAFGSVENKQLLVFPYTIQKKKIIKNDEVYNSWQMGFGKIKDKITMNSEKLKLIKHIVVEYGISEENEYIKGGSELCWKILNECKVPVTLEKNPGGHIDYKLLANRMKTVVFPFFGRSFSQNNESSQIQ